MNLKYPIVAFFILELQGMLAPASGQSKMAEVLSNMMHEQVGAVALQRSIVCIWRRIPRPCCLLRNCFTVWAALPAFGSYTLIRSNREMRGWFEGSRRYRDQASEGVHNRTTHNGSITCGENRNRNKINIAGQKPE